MLLWLEQTRQRFSKPPNAGANPAGSANMNTHAFNASHDPAIVWAIEHGVPCHYCHEPLVFENAIHIGGMTDLCCHQTCFDQCDFLTQKNKVSGKSIREDLIPPSKLNVPMV